MFLAANPKPRKAVMIVSYILTALASALLLFSASFKLMASPEMVKQFTDMGFSSKAMLPLGIYEAACAILILVPRVQVLAAILLTGYLGGAACIHVMQQNFGFGMAILIATVVWVSILMREPVLRRVLPMRR